MSASDTPAAAERRPADWVIVLALGLLMGLQPITTDLYVPAMPQMQLALSTTPSGAQQTLAVLVLSFGFGQLVWGPVADRLGRRPVLISGLSLFVLASLMTVLASDLSVMLLARAAQGACLSAAVVCGRAMVRDLYVPADGARMMARGLTGLGVIALSGPILGGLAAAYLGWRSTLAIVGAAGLLTLLFILTQLPESLPSHRRQARTSMRSMMSDWRAISRHPTFRAHAMLVSSSYGGLYVYLSCSSFVFINVMGSSRQAFGGYMASISLAYLIGVAICRRLLPHHGLVGTVRVAGMAAAGSAAWLILMSVLAATTPFQPSAIWLLPGMWLYGCCHGINQPCGQTGVIAAFPRNAGAASALSGFLLSVMAFVIGGLLGLAMKHHDWAQTVYPLTLGMAAGALMTTWVALGPVQRNGMPAHTAH